MGAGPLGLGHRGNRCGRLLGEAGPVDCGREPATLAGLIEEHARREEDRRDLAWLGVKLSDRRMNPWIGFATTPEAEHPFMHRAIREDFPLIPGLNGRSFLWAGGQP